MIKGITKLAKFANLSHSLSPSYLVTDYLLPVTHYLCIAMTIEITEDEIYEQFQEAGEEQLQWDPSDELDITYKFDARISQGWSREIRLREGIIIALDQHRLTDQWNVSTFEGERSKIWMCFNLLGQEELVSATCPFRYEVLGKARKYRLGSNGLLDKKIFKYSDIEQHSRFYVEVQPEILRSFTSTLDGELPKDLQHLIKSPSEVAYERDKSIQPLMTSVIQQILQCSYQGMVKRAYLESKTIELIALVLDHEIAIQQGEVTKGALKPEQLERIHYAKELLLRNMGNPPSLAELARQAGLNDLMLRQGFRQAFGTTVFGQLQAYRLDVAKQLLAEQDITVDQVAHHVGYASTTSFTKAFKRKFDVTPKAYQKTWR